MQTTEKTYNGIKPFVDLIVGELLETFPELVIAVESNVMWRPITIIHKILKTHISGLLEPHIIIEGSFNEIIHLTFELEKFDRKFEWVLQILLIFHNLSTLLKNKRIHLIDYVDQSGASPVENSIHHGKLIDFVLSEHVLTPRFFLSETLRLFLDSLLEQDVKNLLF